MPLLISTEDYTTKDCGCQYLFEILHFGKTGIPHTEYVADWLSIRSVVFVIVPPQKSRQVI